jgi:RNA polymerase sigma-70 factor (ECF subfamily)
MGHSDDSAPEPFSPAARDRLVRLAYRFVWNRDDAEDVVQDSLVAAHAQQRQLRQPDRWWSWLRRIVIHRCHTAGRKKTSWRTHAPRLMAETTRKLAGDSEGEADASHVKELVRQALIGLSARQKEVVVLRHLEGMSYEEIAAVLEISAVTARVHARAGLESLRAILAKQGLEARVR